MDGKGAGTVDRRIAIALAGLAIGIGLLGACTGSDAFDGGRSTRPAGTATTATTEPADPSAPTAAAAARAEVLQAVPDDGTDCGTVAADSGWPTTTIASPGTAGACLVDALAAHRPAVMTFTGRTGDGGALVTRYALDAAGSVVVTAHTVTSTGVDTRTTATCTPPPGAWSIGIEGRVVVAGPNPAYC